MTDADEEEAKKKVACWSSEMMEEKTSKYELKDTEEVVQWTSVNQGGVDNLWKELCGQMEEVFLEKYKVEESKKGAHKGRGESLELRIVQRVKKYELRK